MTARGRRRVPGTEVAGGPADTRQTASGTASEPGRPWVAGERPGRAVVAGPRLSHGVSLAAESVAVGLVNFTLCLPLNFLEMFCVFFFQIFNNIFQYLLKSRA